MYSERTRKIGGKTGVLLVRVFSIDRALIEKNWL